MSTAATCPPRRTGGCAVGPPGVCGRIGGEFGGGGGGGGGGDAPAAAAAAPVVEEEEEDMGFDLFD